MTMGHFATALLPGSRSKAPIWLLLLCANFGDFLWLALAIVGLEPTQPDSFVDVSVSGLKADMQYSHSLGWQLGLAALITVLVYAALRDRAAALWCGALVVGHLLCDYLCGFSHPLLGRDSPTVGLDLYQRAPYMAFIVEAVFAAGCVAYYVRAEAKAGNVLPWKKRAVLYAVFAGGSLFFLPNATHSMRQLWALV